MVQIDKLKFSVDFVVLEMEEDEGGTAHSWETIHEDSQGCHQCG